MDKIPETFAKFIMNVWEEEGAAWLASLPGLVAAYEERWSFSAESPFPDLSYNYAAPVRLADGRQAVLKLGVPRNEILTEIEALRLYDGRGICRLLEADPEAGVMLLERLRPGRMLLSLAEEDDGAATAVAADLMRQLWRPVPENHSFPSIADWHKGLARMREEFDSGTGPFPKHLVDAAEGYYQEFTADPIQPVLLHGDFHHWNVMTAERAPWLAIDPKGIVGPPAYEVGALLKNPTGILTKWPDLPRLMARRIDILSDRLGIDRQRIIGWGVYGCVISGWWSYEDQGYGWEEAMELGEVILSC
jgi:streptomycin 6-kinase